MSLANPDALIGDPHMAATDTTTGEQQLPKIGRPSKGADAMRSRTVRCDDPTWEKADERAKADGLDLGKVIRHYLREYANGA